MQPLQHSQEGIGRLGWRQEVAGPAPRSEGGAERRRYSARVERGEYAQRMCSRPFDGRCPYQLVERRLAGAITVPSAEPVVGD